MATQEKNICNILRESWRSLIVLIDYLESFLRKILDQIKSLIARIKNSILRRILSIIRSLEEYISQMLGLQVIDNNLARQTFCSVLYACEPAIKEIANFVSPELFNKIFGPDSIKTIDLAQYGIASLTFNSKFELFEYVACRLSLRGLLDSITNNIISQLMAFLDKFLKYLDVDWWLQNTVWGRALNRLLNEYENVFNDRIKPFLNRLIPYLNCSFALCDFTVSTNNYFDDFEARFKARKVQKPDLSYEFEILKSDLYSDLTDSLNSTKAEVEVFKSTLVAPIESAKPLFHTRKTGEDIGNESTQNKTTDDAQTLPYNSTEKSISENNLYDRNSSLVPGVKTNSPIALRRVIVESSPNSRYA